jgi:lipoprotein-releasing system permease protein
MHYELFIALKYITSRKRQTFLSVGAIGIAVMMIVISQGFMAGFTEELYDTTVDELAHVTISPEEGNNYIHLYKNLIDSVGKIEGVTGVSPYLTGEAIVKHKDDTQNVVLKGIVPERETEVSQINRDIIKGNFSELKYTKNSIVVGDDLLPEINAKIGDVVDASFPDANPISLKIVGVYDTGSDDDRDLTYTSLKTAQDFYGTSDVVNGVSLRVSNVNNDRKIAENIQDMGYEASGWTETNPEILRTIAIETMSNNIMLGLIVIIASFGVVSNLNMTVLEKKKEIGILRAMGMGKSNIRLIFIFESGILGLIGAVTGTIFGIIIALSIGNYPIPAGLYGGITSIPVVVRPLDVTITVTAVFLLNLIAGVYPAHKAASLNPVEAISG